jgi:uncharacterized repeat protein (TIGR02543 family)
VNEGGKVAEPGAITKTGHAFGGWYKETGLTNPWNFATDTVTADITLYAKWTGVYTVTFDARGGTPVPPAQTVASGGKATKPADPDKDGFLLAGWFKEDTFANRWDFDTDTVTGNITLYARWVDDNHWAVTWELNGGEWSDTPPADEVEKGETITRPADPAKPDCAFGGWYTEAELSNQWDFNTVPTASIFLYAKWTATVSFNANGGTAVTAQIVAEGGKATKPADPDKDGFLLAGWFKEDTFANRWDFDTDTVTGNITLYAKWIPTYTYTGDGIAFKTVYIPGGITFPTGYNDSGTATVANAYEIGETEITYELWYAVRAWAESKGYSFYNNPGREGSSASSQNTTPGANKQEPVTEVSWFDAVVWLNALTEWVNAKEGKSLEPVYYYDSAYTRVAKNSDYSSNFVKENSSYSYASAYAKPGATGFRLPTSNEWELAARWRNDAVNTVSGYSNPYFTQGDSASGATADYTGTTATGRVAWYSSSKTHTVKGKGANGQGERIKKGVKKG